jgi:hypothetical protein
VSINDDIMSVDCFSSNFSGPCSKQGCGSGSVSGMDPDSMGCLDPEPDLDSESGFGSRGKKKKKMKKNLNLFYLKISLIF